MAVHRFKANESAEDDSTVETSAVSAKTSTKSTTKKAAAPKQANAGGKAPRKVFAPFRAIGGYFKGSWQELRQVRWPNRKQTWAMTLAVIILSLALGIFIFLLDAGFTLVFKNFIF